jgi:hypothetical protein
VTFHGFLKENGHSVIIFSFSIDYRRLKSTINSVFCWGGAKGKEGWRVRMSKGEKRDFAEINPHVLFPAL